jgi:hypothetical protein
MKFEPQTFFIGIIDLFSVLLPGALATALLRHVEKNESLSKIFTPFTDSNARWATFLFASYLLGHFIFLLGSILDELIYDKLRSRASDEKVYFLSRTRKLIGKNNSNKNSIILNEVTKQIEQALKADESAQEEMLNKLRQATNENMLKSSENDVSVELKVFEKIQKKLKRYEAWQKNWLRPIWRWMLTQMFAASPDLAVRKALEIRSGYLPEVKDGSVINAFQ